MPRRGRRSRPRRAAKVDPFKPVIDAIPRADLCAPRKQRHSLKRIFDPLVDKHGMTDVPTAAERGGRASLAVPTPSVRAAAAHAPTVGHREIVVVIQ